MSRHRLPAPVWSSASWGEGEPSGGPEGAAGAGSSPAARRSMKPACRSSARSAPPGTTACSPAGAAIRSACCGANRDGCGIREFSRNGGSRLRYSGRGNHRCRMDPENGERRGRCRGHGLADRSAELGDDHLLDLAHGIRTSSSRRTRSSRTRPRCRSGWICSWSISRLGIEIQKWQNAPRLLVENDLGANARQDLLQGLDVEMRRRVTSAAL